MRKYINADKLIAKLRKHLLPTVLDRDYDQWEMGKDAGLLQAIEIVDSLLQEQPEVDLKEEFHRWLSKEKEEWGGEIPPYGEYGLFGIARHFYELGLNARKEE